ncbi:hypothetical protein [Streptomyces liliifuscus]|uniref:Uncharacterized protein n=1 Tax=Streptomyces liliifuscus TaxID=2797636 RepID=A0A7T7KZ92_9ACTN|nr:hypothetical protein [Streptomyces liliifuscus]QQM43536.1 hypothetical protein JEQ17_31900 [Streptomyces liliifuscus]
MTSTAHTHDRPVGDACPYCGWPDRAEPFQVVSRHGTAAGQTVWTRCGCGSLQMRVVDARGMNVVTRSRPATRRSADRVTSGGVGCSLRAGGG